MARIQGDLKERTLAFAVAVLDLVNGLPNNGKGWEIGRQLIRSGTSVGANVREADAALTDAEFAHKCSLSRKEANEAHYWLILCEKANLLQGDELRRLMQEADELVRILGAIVRTTQEYLKK